MAMREGGLKLSLVSCSTADLYSSRATNWPLMFHLRDHEPSNRTAAAGEPCDGPVYGTMPESEVAGWHTLVQQFPHKGPLCGEACEADHACRLHHDLFATNNTVTLVIPPYAFVSQAAW